MRYLACNSCHNDSEAGRLPEITADGRFSYGNTQITLEEAYKAWTGTLEKVFPTRSGVEDKEINTGLYDTKDIYV